MSAMIPRAKRFRPGLASRLPKSEIQIPDLLSAAILGLDVKLVLLGPNVVVHTRVTNIATTYTRTDEALTSWPHRRHFVTRYTP